MDEQILQFLQGYLPPSTASSSGDERPLKTLPFVTLTYAQSLDAKLAKHDRKPLQLSGAETRRLTHQIRAAHDAVLVGVGTFDTDDPGLNGM